MKQFWEKHREFALCSVLVYGSSYLGILTALVLGHGFPFVFAAVTLAQVLGLAAALSTFMYGVSCI